jgi:DNA-binding NarL/FixJ family response regulator
VIPDVRKRRVLLLEMPKMLQELARAAVAGEADIEVVGEAADGAELGSAVASLHPDLVLLRSEDAELSPAYRALFDDQPQLKVLALTDEGADGHLWELAPHHIALGEMSPRALVSAIRDPRPWRWRT